MTVELTVDGKKYQIHERQLRRMMSVTYKQLIDLKKKEGGMFPQIDRETLNLIIKLQTNHVSLI